MKPIVVFVHIHYLETWPTLSVRITANIERPFRLVVTTTRKAADISPPQSIHMTGFDVIETDNRGRDVLPFLLALRETVEFEIGLKLHGKRSIHRLDGEAWREALVGSLLPEGGETGPLLRRLEGDPRIGLIGPRNSLCSIERHFGDNDHSMKAVAHSLGEPLSELIDRTPFFSAGTMFWFRREALIDVAELNPIGLFTDERGQTDGTAAHALERLFPAVAEAKGFHALSVDAAMETTATTPTAALREAALRRVDIDETFVRLPGPLAAFVMRRLRFAVPVYLALPKPMRRAIKASASGALVLLKRR